jgi:hypothetical protein
MSFLPETTIARLIDWDGLREAVSPWIGERAATQFAYAISAAFGSSACADYFRGMLEDAGDDPDHPQLTEVEQLLIDWGRLIATSPASISEEFYTRLESAFSPETRKTLLEFATSTVAINLTAIVGRIA